MLNKSFFPIAIKVYNSMPKASKMLSLLQDNSTYIKYQDKEIDVHSKTVNQLS